MHVQRVDHSERVAAMLPNIQSLLVREKKLGSISLRSMRCSAIRATVAAATHVWTLVAVATVVRVRSVELGAEAIASEAIAAAKRHASWWSWTSGVGWVAAKHGHARAILGATERDHVLANVGSYELTVLGRAIGQDVLDEIVAELISCDYSLVRGRHLFAHREWTTYYQSRACEGDRPEPHRPFPSNDRESRYHQS